MMYTKFVLVLSVILCFSQFCYGNSLDSKNITINRIELTQPSSLSTKANGINASCSLKKNPSGVSFGVMDPMGTASDSNEKIKKENDYVKQHVEYVRD